jgi:hypothetical protein
MVFLALDFESNYCKKLAMHDPSCRFWLSSGQQLEQLSSIAIGLWDLIVIGIDALKLC